MTVAGCDCREGEISEGSRGAEEQRSMRVWRSCQCCDILGRGQTCEGKERKGMHR